MKILRPTDFSDCVAVSRAALTVVVAIAIWSVAASSNAQDHVQRGRQVFMSSGCYGCHIVGKMGTPIGPELSGVGAKYSRAYFERWLRDPSAQRPNAHMPTLELSEQQVTALAAFLSSLR
ncbi:MAG: c-type cytochrome [Candidatus Rokuibacteriota bacterium]